MQIMGGMQFGQGGGGRLCQQLLSILGNQQWQDCLRY